MSNNKLYVPNEAEWRKHTDRDLHCKDIVSYKEYNNVYIEPPRRQANKGADTIKVGGVCYPDGKHIAGLIRNPLRPAMNLSIHDSYKPDKAPDVYLDEECIYGGVIVNIFGHIIADTMVRLWYVVKHSKGTEKIVFINMDGDVLPIFWEIIDLLKIERDRIVIIFDKLYCVKKITVPDQSFYNYGQFTDEACTVYDFMRKSAFERLDPNTELSQKVYFTRSQFHKKDCINEEYFESFYRKRGFKIVAPETLSFTEQIQIFASAEEVVTTPGTIPIMLFFSDKRPKVTILIRANEVNACAHTLLFQAKGITDYTYIDVSMNIFPTTHAGGVFLLGPTKHWKSYLDENGIEYTADELEMDWSCLHDYLAKYAEVYSVNRYSYKRVKHLDIFDVIASLSNVMLDKNIDRKAMDTRSKPELEKDIESCNGTIDDLSRAVRYAYCNHDDGEDVQVISGDGIVTLAWKPVKGADKYAVSVYKDGKYNVLTKELKGTGYTVTGLTNGAEVELLLQHNINGKWSDFTTEDHIHVIVGENSGGYQTDLRVPECLQVVSAAKKMPKLLTVNASQELVVNGAVRDYDSYCGKLKKSLPHINKQWDTMLGIAYTYCLERNYDMVINVPKDADISLCEHDIRRLSVSAIDMVLDGGHRLKKRLKQHFAQSCGDELCEMVAKALDMHASEYLVSYDRVMSGMTLLDGASFIMKKAAFVEYAEWLLPLLNEIASNVTSKEMALLPVVRDVLLTAYCEHNKDSLVVALLR